MTQKKPAQKRMFGIANRKADRGGEHGAKGITRASLRLEILHHWSSTQATIALSSAEAELNGIVKACNEGLGFQNVLCEFNREVPIQIGTDSNAAKGIACRRGAGKVNHLETRQLWVQDLIFNNRVHIEKVPRNITPTDLSTHHWLKADGIAHLTRMSIKS